MDVGGDVVEGADVDEVGDTIVEEVVVGGLDDVTCVVVGAPVVLAEEELDVVGAVVSPVVVDGAAGNWGCEVGPELDGSDAATTIDGGTGTPGCVTSPRTSPTAWPAIQTERSVARIQATAPNLFILIAWQAATDVALNDG